MNSTSNEASSMGPPPPESAAPFSQLLALLAQEPALSWLKWLLCQREAAAWPAEERLLRSRSRTAVAATFLAAGEEAPPAGGAAGGQGVPIDDCPHCRRQATRFFGPRPLEVLGILEHSAHPRIWKIYRRGLSRFVAFREEAGLPSVWPIPNEQIRDFLVALDSQYLSSPKILGYLAGLSFISQMLQFPDPLQDFFISRMAIAFLKRRDIQQRGCTPISQDTLACLVGVLDRVCTSFYDCILFRAVFILAWFAALRPEEIVPEDAVSLDPALLNLRDFEFSENAVDIQLRVLGVGPERFAFRLVRAKQPRLCPVLALSNYMAARPRREGPFFLHSNGEPLDKEQFQAVLHPALRLLGLFPQHFSLHSFWLGAVISAVRHRLSEDIILRLVRWPNRGQPQ